MCFVVALFIMCYHDTMYTTGSSPTVSVSAPLPLSWWPLVSSLIHEKHVLKVFLSYCNDLLIEWYYFPRREILLALEDARIIQYVELSVRALSYETQTAGLYSHELLLSVPQKHRLNHRLRDCDIVGTRILGYNQWLLLLIELIRKGLSDDLVI